MAINISQKVELREALAVIGVGLFVFGIWEIYPPAAFIISGLILAAPFIFALRKVK